MKTRWNYSGADERTRTSTTLRPLEPESSASANSATSALILMQPAFCQSGEILSICSRELSTVYSELRQHRNCAGDHVVGRFEAEGNSSHFPARAFLRCNPAKPGGTIRKQ